MHLIKRNQAGFTTGEIPMEGDFIMQAINQHRTCLTVFNLRYSCSPKKCFHLHSLNLSDFGRAGDPKMRSELKSLI